MCPSRCCGQHWGLSDTSGVVTTNSVYDSYGHTRSTGTLSSNSAEYTGQENDDIGLPNYFTARAAQGGDHAVFALAIDSIALPQRVSFVKIDTEGAESAVLRSMEALIQRDHPILSIEGDESLEPYPAARGYRMVSRLPGSPNLLFLPPGFTTDLQN